MSGIGRAVRNALLAYAEEVRSEFHPGLRGYYDYENERFVEYGGEAAIERAGWGYDDRNRAHANAILRKGGVRVALEAAEGIWQQTLSDYDSGARAAAVSSPSERVAAFRAAISAGGCVVCGQQAREGRKTCVRCNDAAKLRVRASRVAAC